MVYKIPEALFLTLGTSDVVSLSVAESGKDVEIIYGS